MRFIRFLQLFLASCVQAFWNSEFTSVENFDPFMFQGGHQYGSYDLTGSFARSLHRMLKVNQYKDKTSCNFLKYFFRPFEMHDIFQRSIINFFMKTIVSTGFFWRISNINHCFRKMPLSIIDKDFFHYLARDLRLWLNK